MSNATASSAAPSKMAVIARWTLQGLVAAAFLAAGAAKLAGAPPVVAIFAQIGAGQWFRYVTALVEITGAVLLLWPGRSGFGAALLEHRTLKRVRSDALTYCVASDLPENRCALFGPML